MNRHLSFLFYKKYKLFFIAIGVLILFKVIWVVWSCWGNGSFRKEKNDILQRRNYLIENVIVEPKVLLDKMPSVIGSQFQGEWALYSCSMTAQALTNIAMIYPETKQDAITHLDSIIQIVMSHDIRLYDKSRWGEDPLENLDGDKSHLSYLSHLAWIIGNYKWLSFSEDIEKTQYDELYSQICETLNRRILVSGIMNIPTYPHEPIYVPDMLVAIVALNNYPDHHYKPTVEKWISKARSEWIDKNTGLLVSFLDENGQPNGDIKGSYSALNSYYLTLIEPSEFAKAQYDNLKKYFKQSFPFTGLKEYRDKSCWFEMDIDAGPIICNLSPSGTAFVIGPATYFEDTDYRNGLLKTAEIFGHTVRSKDKRHYLLGQVALVGETIALAMRTTRPCCVP